MPLTGNDKARAALASAAPMPKSRPSLDAILLPSKAAGSIAGPSLPHVFARYRDKRLSPASHGATTESWWETGQFLKFF